jgi:hypothetical protein
MCYISCDDGWDAISQPLKLLHLHSRFVESRAGLQKLGELPSHENIMKAKNHARFDGYGSICFLNEEMLLERKILTTP